MTKILVIDNYDSFVYTLNGYLLQLGAETEVLRNDAFPEEDAASRIAEYDAVLLSPGPGTPASAGLSIPIVRAALAAGSPLLGVCLGHQAIAVACGSAVERTYPVHGKIAQIRHDGSGLFAGIPSPFAATRYHSLAVSDPNPPLIANAWSDDGTVMAMLHTDAPVHGIQFHPESIASEQGRPLLSAFLAACSLHA